MASLTPPPPSAPATDASPSAPHEFAAASMPTPAALEEAKAAARRERHRQNMARGRQRQGAAMAAMRQEHALLVERQRELLAAQQRRQQREAEPRGRAEVMGRFVDAINEENAIHREREMLAQRLEQLEIFEAALRVDAPPLAADTPSALADESMDESMVRGQKQTLSRRGYMTYFTPDETPFYYEPISEQTCRAWIRDMYQQSKRHHARFSRRLAERHSSVAQCFGWSVQRSLVDGRHLHFHFSKRFPSCDPDALAVAMLEHGWHVFHDPKLYARIYRTVMIAKVLQRVDAFNSVIIRNSPSPNRTHNIRSLTIMSKIDDHDDQGRRTLSILTLVIEPPEDMANHNSNGVLYIRDAYTYIVFTVGTDAATGPYVEMTYGGHGDCLSEAQAQYLFVETGHVLFRFEQMLYPRNLVTQG